MLIGYMRVSSGSDRQTTDLQRDALIASGVDSRHLFEDHASGTKDDRSGLSEALAFVRPGDVLVVWKLDRLGRSLSHLLSIVNSLKDKQVAFRSLTEGMDTTSASGELLFHVFGALAQYERSLIGNGSLRAWRPLSGADGWAADRAPSLERSWTPSSPHWTVVCPRLPYAATLELNAPL